MTLLSFFAAVASLAFSQPAPVPDQVLTDKDAFVDANLRAIFYHELGHAVIDLMDVPIFGQEEDAADVMSVLLIDWLYDEDTAQSIAYDSAFGYISDPEGKEDVPYWDLHGPDEQRYFNHICLFFGANPEERDDLAAELGLPEERAEYCPEEYDQAAESWGAVFDRMEAQSAHVPMTFVAGTGPEADVIKRVLEPEITSLSRDLKLPKQLTVKVESCDEPNAFYDPQDVSIILCTEFVGHLIELYEFFEAE